MRQGNQHYYGHKGPFHCHFHFREKGGLLRTRPLCTPLVTPHTVLRRMAGLRHRCCGFDAYILATKGAPIGGAIMAHACWIMPSPRLC